MGVLDDHVVVITGAGGGIGRAHALASAAAGAKVVVNDIGVDLDGAGGSHAPAESVVAEIEAAGGTAVANFDSVADFEAAGRIVSHATSTFGRLDALVNNASVFRDGPFETLAPEDFAAEIATHLVGTFNTCKHAIPQMVAQGRGRIVNTTSSSWSSAAGLAGYAAAKAGVLGLSFDLAAEYWRKGITVNVISPIALTEHRVVQGQRWIDKLREAGLMEDFVSSMTGQSDGRDREPADHIPPIVVFLASDAAASISGKVFEVTGNSIGVFAHPRVDARIAKDPDAGPWTQRELERLMLRSLLGGVTRPPHLGP
ncbi:MAG: SDR family NAD(P)-dependent oxidoreductase [Acidimicrobiales bacterium]